MSETWKSVEVITPKFIFMGKSSFFYWDCIEFHFPHTKINCGVHWILAYITRHSKLGTLLDDKNLRALLLRIVKNKLCSQKIRTIRTLVTSKCSIYYNRLKDFLQRWRKTETEFELIYVYLKPEQVLATADEIVAILEY